MLICHYWFFNNGFKCQDCAYNSCHDLTMLRLNISDIVLFMSKFEAVHLLKTSVLDDRGYI